MDWVHSILEGCFIALRESHPFWLVSGMVILPLLGVPVSPLWILGGLRFGSMWGVMAAVSAGVLNVTIGYWVAAWCFRAPIQKLLARRGHKVPSLAAQDESTFTLLCRITPGIPLVLQNYLLGCARVHFGRYFCISLPIVCAYGVAFVLFGNALRDTQVWRIILAGCLVVAVALFIRLLRKWAGNDGNKSMPNESRNPVSPV